MALHNKLLQILMLWVIAAASQVIRPDCQEKCGNVSIPYPFGTREGCCLNEDFLITCNETSNSPFLGDMDSNIEVLNISLDGELRILTLVASDCYNERGDHIHEESYDVSINLHRFPFSTTRNKFTVVGCDAYAFIQGSHGMTGCFSRCDNIRSVSNGSCSGVGCCQTSIPKMLLEYEVSVWSFHNHTHVWSFNPCSYTFLVEEESFHFTLADLRNLQNRSQVPTVLNWAIGNQTCEEARKNSTSYACQAHSDCYKSHNGPGYRCNCSKGYQGNPYLPSGCQDINECADTSLNDCKKQEYCANVAGNYTCSCPKGYHGDGTKHGEGCTANQYDQSLVIIKVTVGIIISLLVLLLLSSWLYWGLRQRKLIKLKEKFFQQNGGLMLQQELSKHIGSVETAKIFTAEDLKKATNNYHESRFLGQGGQGAIYKGILPDNKIVAVKNSKIGDQSQVQQFINEVIVISQVNHRNLVKLLGCCLETQVPLLVYEFVTNGTLFDHIHNAGHASSIPWETRLQIATETAGALSYLHSATSTPIIHTDVKTANILLDDNYIAKVSDFGVSRLIPLNKSQLTKLVQGTPGYLDPEYFHTSQLTEKSDVYSFGVVLVELLTGKMALSFGRPEGERNLAMYFIYLMKENRLFEVLDHQLLNEGNAKQVKEVATLAKRCLRVKGEERPTMKEVAMKLEGLRAMEKQGEVNLGETQFLPNELFDTYDAGTSSNTTGYDNITKQIIVAFDDER